MAYIRDNANTLLPQHESLITGLIRARDYERLASISDEIGFAYLKPHPARVLFQIEAFFKKNEEFTDDQSCTDAARASFFEAEDLCRDTNVRLALFEHCWGIMPPSSKEYELSLKVQRMRTDIGKLLGPLDTFIRQLPFHIKVSSGASSTRPKRKAQPYRKVGKLSVVTPGAEPLLKALWSYSAMEGDLRLKQVNCNRVTVVPKSWKTHRAIAAEPEGNLLFQLAIDSYLKDRLRSRGIDLSSQERNQELALRGSLYNDLATVDLSKASDTVALELIPFLLPEDWAEFLFSLRSPYYKGDFGPGKYEKFSSMGNGFTFPIETTIFWAACRAVRSKVVSVYGDDIIIDSDKYEPLVELLSLLGFLVNKEKTFHKGPFRESCGADYFLGENVRPFFVRESGHIPKHKACHNINGLCEIALDGGELEAYLVAITRKFRLPIVPWNENTTSGVFALPWLLHRKKLLRFEKSKDGSRNWVHSFKGYVVKEDKKRIRHWKTYLYWHVARLRYSDRVGDLLPTSRIWCALTLNRDGKRLLAGQGDPLVTSEVGSGIEKIRFASVAWNPPHAEPPVHLYRWTALLDAQSFE